MSGPDYSKRDYLLPQGCKDLADTLVITVPKAPTAADLARLLGKRPAGVLADLFQLGIFVSEKQVLDFEALEQVARKYGYIARRA